MAAAFKVYAYRDSRARSIFWEWLDGLMTSNPRAAAKASYLIDLLSDHGTSLRLPVAKNVEGPIYELRGRSGHDPVRLYYFQMSGTEFMVVAGEVKEQDSADRGLIDLALKVYREHMREKKGKKGS